MRQNIQRFYNSPLGYLHLQSDGESLIGLTFSDCLNKSHKDKEEPCNALKKTIKWLDIYFSAEIPTFMPPIKIQSGSAFAREVWELLLQVPYGQLSTYGALAKQIAQRYNIAKMSAQAIGRAVGSNPIAIIIPCHRIIGANKNLVGYAGGLEKKITLLQIEGIDTTKFRF